MEPGTAIAVGQVSAKVLSIISKYYSDVKDAKNKIEYLANEVHDLQLVVKNLQEIIKNPTTQKLPTSASLDQTIEQSLLDMKKLEKKLNPGTGDRAMKKVGKRALKWPFTAKETEEWMARLQRLKGTINLALNTDQSSLIAGVGASVAQLKLGQEATELERQLGKLPVAVAAAFNSYHRQHESPCATDTRVQLLAQLRDWSETHQRKIFWLSGMAGTGKSTISRSLAIDLQARNTLAGSFFFSRSSGEANNAMNFVGTLAYHLANQMPQVKERICEAISLHSEVLQQGLRNQWDEFILRPLSKLQITPRPVWNFVIDALDECDSDNEIRLLLQLLVEIKGLDTVDLGVFVTSRPEIVIRLGFTDMPDFIHQNLDLRDVPRPIIEHDIMILLRREFGLIGVQNKLENWPNEDDLRMLVRNADSLFIYAATVCRFVKDSDWDPEDRLSIILGSESAGEATAHLDNMYTQILRSALIKGRGEEDAAKLCERFIQIVGSIVVISDELSISSLSNLLCVPITRVERSLNSLHSLLDIQEDLEIPIRLLHPSFRDFLVDEKRCKDSHFFVEKTVTHGMLAMRCLEVLSVSLKRNICKLPTPGSSPHDVQRDILSEQLPKHVQYACQYWEYHLSASSSDFKAQAVADDKCRVRNFFWKDFLQWLEAMSLMGRMSQAVLIVSRLVNMTELERNHAIFAMIKDAERFMLTHRHIVEKAPLQTYASALIFSPINSLVRKCYANQLPSWVTLSPEPRENWSNCVFTLEGHQDEITQIAFSPDGKYLASSSHDKTVMIWDLATGALQFTLKGHHDQVIAIAFSGEKVLTSASKNGTVCFWDIITGENRNTLHLEIEESQTLSRMLLLPEAQVAVEWRDGDNSHVGLWNLEQGRMLIEILHEFENIQLQAASPGGLLAALRDTRQKGVVEITEVIVYDLNAGVVIYKCGSDLEGSVRVKAVALSSDSQLAVGRSDGVVELHDPVTKRTTQLKDREDRVSILAFCPNGSMLVSASDNGIANLWDLSTLQSVRMERWPRLTICLVFAPDGKHIACSDYIYGAVRLWTASSRPPEDDDTDQTALVHRVIFSPGGDQIAVSYSDGSMKLYDISGEEIGVLQAGHGRDYDLMTFSHKGHLLAIPSEEQTDLWSTRDLSSANVLPFTTLAKSQDVDFQRHSFFFSADDKLVASNEFEGIPIWDPATGQLLHMLEVYEQHLRASVFSLSGREIASTWSDQAARVWDTRTGRLLYKLEGVKIHESTPGITGSIAFSPDGRSLAYQAMGGRVSSHDWQTNKQPTDFEDVDVEKTEQLMYSNSGEILAHVSCKAITLWDIRTTRHIKTIHDLWSGMQASFSTDDSYLNTDHGCLKLGEPFGSLTNRNYWNNFDEEWIKEGDRKMLWLPPGFRYLRAYHDGLFVFCDDSERKLHFLRFTQDEVITEVSD